MFTMNDLAKISENGGATLKKFNAVSYKTGYQVATEGQECATLQEAWKAIEGYAGNCGIWLSQGIYYIDKSHRVSTKRDALALGRATNQISVLKWSDMSLVYC